MEEFIFRLLDRYGVSIVIVVIVLLLVWKVAPEIVKVWIDKIRAETELIRATQIAVTTTIPSAIGELKVTFIAEHKSTVGEIKNAIGAETDRRIEERLSQIEREQRAAKIEAPPPSREIAPSRPG